MIGFDNHFAEIKGIPRTDRRVLCAMATFAGKDYRCWASASSISSRSFVSVRSVMYALRRLELAGYITRTDKRGNLNGHGSTILYRLNSAGKRYTSEIEHPRLPIFQ